MTKLSESVEQAQLILATKTFYYPLLQQTRD